MQADTDQFPVLGRSGRTLGVRIGWDISADADGLVRDLIRADSAPNGEIEVSESPDAVAVLWKKVPVVLAQKIAEDTVLLRTDLRPFGIEIFDDAAGLHIGSSVLSGNSFSGCSIGIALG